MSTKGIGMFGSDLTVVEQLLREVLHEQRTTNRLLIAILRQERTMTDKITQAFIDLDAEIQTVGTDIMDLVARLAATPPGPDADAIAAQIESRVASLKTVADPLKSVAVAPAIVATTPVSDTPVPAEVVPPAPEPVAEPAATPPAEPTPPTT